ncbi:hypothetical protein GCM10007107_25980 [Shewanella indica]|nr:hypothetical protein GCM10007107_25980 [Shewanella indica]
MNISGTRRIIAVLLTLAYLTSGPAVAKGGFYGQSADTGITDRDGYWDLRVGKTDTPDTAY